MANEPGPVKRNVDKAADTAAETTSGGAAEIPGAPGSAAPQVEEPVEPHGPLPLKPGQDTPAALSATGRPRTDPATAARAQNGPFLTNAQGARLHDTDHSLKAGPRGPVLLQDHHLREKITHFDHERIPERVVHARGAAARTASSSRNGYGDVACAEAGLPRARTPRPPVFVRFSTVLGSRGSADTVRDTRGFATKFYTDEGVFDLVGNNIPVFFIQDAHQVPGRHPRRQAASRPRDPAGAERARHLLGLRVPAHRGHRTTRCGTCPTGASRAPSG